MAAIFFSVILHALLGLLHLDIPPLLYLPAFFASFSSSISSISFLLLLSSSSSSSKNAKTAIGYRQKKPALRYVAFASARTQNVRTYIDIPPERVLRARQDVTSIYFILRGGRALEAYNQYLWLGLITGQVLSLVFGQFGMVWAWLDMRLGIGLG